MARDEDAPSYAASDYWDQRYAEGVRWSWYYSYEDLLPLFERHLGELAPLRVLEVGCGDTPLAPAFARSTGEGGFDAAPSLGGRTVAIDFAPSIIRGMRKSHRGQQVEFMVMDARQMAFDDGAFDVVIDKGTMDAMLSEVDEDEGLENAAVILMEVTRLVAAGGYATIVSHLNPLGHLGRLFLESVLVPVLAEHGDSTWIVHVHGDERDLEADKGDLHPVVYMIHRRPRPRTRSRTRRKRKRGDGSDGDPGAAVSVRMEFH